MRSPAKRLFVIVAAIATIVGCSSPTTPAPSHIAQPEAPRFDIDSTMCRSGWNSAQGRCNGDN